MLCVSATTQSWRYRGRSRRRLCSRHFPAAGARARRDFGDGRSLKNKRPGCQGRRTRCQSTRFLPWFAFGLRLWDFIGYRPAAFLTLQCTAFLPPCPPGPSRPFSTTNCSPSGVIKGHRRLIFGVCAPAHLFSLRGPGSHGPEEH